MRCASDVPLGSRRMNTSWTRSTSRRLKPFLCCELTRGEIYHMPRTIPEKRHEWDQACLALCLSSFRASPLLARCSAQSCLIFKQEDGGDESAGERRLLQSQSLLRGSAGQGAMRYPSSTVHMLGLRMIESFSFGIHLRVCLPPLLRLQQGIQLPYLRYYAEQRQRNNAALIMPLHDRMLFTLGKESLGAAADHGNVNDEGPRAP